MSGWLFQGHLSAALGGAALTQIEIFKPQVALEHPMLLKQTIDVVYMLMFSAVEMSRSGASADS